MRERELARRAETSREAVTLKPISQGVIPRIEVWLIPPNQRREASATTAESKAGTQISQSTLNPQKGSAWSERSAGNEPGFFGELPRAGHGVARLFPIQTAWSEERPERLFLRILRTLRHLRSCLWTGRDVSRRSTGRERSLIPEA